SSSWWITTKWWTSSGISIGFVIVAIFVSPHKSPPYTAGNRFGAATCAARIKDRMNRTMMMDQFTQLFQGLFAYSPRSSLSFNKSCRKMMAEGNITPASTCTPRMISCSGAFTSGFFKHAVLLMMINAAVLGTTAISLSSAWAYGEIRGWPHSLQLPMRKAPGFYVADGVSVGAAARRALIPRAPLQLIIRGVQVLAGVMLPSAIIFLQLLLNDKELLGEHANKPWNNWVNWTIIIVLFILSLILAAQVAAPNLFPAV